jgi:hypothetical protein
MPVDLNTGQPLLQTKIEQIHLLNPSLKEPWISLAQNDRNKLSVKFKRKFGYDMDLLLLLRIDLPVVPQLIDGGNQDQVVSGGSNDSFRSERSNDGQNCNISGYVGTTQMGRFNQNQIGSVGFGDTGRRRDFGGNPHFGGRNVNSRPNIVQMGHNGMVPKHHDVDSLRHMLRLHYNELCYELLTLEISHKNKLKKIQREMKENDNNNNKNVEKISTNKDRNNDQDQLPQAPYPLPYPILSPNLPTVPQSIQFPQNTPPNGLQNPQNTFPTPSNPYHTPPTPQPTYDSTINYIDNISDSNLYEYVERERYELAKLGLDHLIPVFYSPLHEV